MQERGNSYDHNSLSLKYKLDNEFELVFVVAFQKILQLSYIDKFLSDIQLEFRDKYKNALTSEGREFQNYDFSEEFGRLLKQAESSARKQASIPQKMKTFEESQKSKKTVSSMIERKGETAPVKKQVKIVEAPKIEDDDELNGNSEDVILANRKKLMEKLNKKPPKKSPKSPIVDDKKKKKEARKWELNGNEKDAVTLDRSKDCPEDARVTNVDMNIVGSGGKIQDYEIDDESSDEDSYDEDESEEDSNSNNVKSQQTKKTKGVFSLFSKLVGSKAVTLDDMQPCLEKLRDHLITKNVATDIAAKLCDSVGAKLEGKVLGTFDTIAATVKATLNDSLVQILSPKRRVDILRDCMEAKKHNRPYVMAFCGVNGVGKSTNLAKICFWLIENNFNVLIAACDTFRAGAVEQLRTHTRHLNALHPPNKHNGRTMVQLYEKGYGKDAAGIAMEAIRSAKDSGIDVVLVDTAGRMQDNEPLMRALAKLIKVNEPDLVLFVGEALVGNEAVDQLVKFNQALADYSAMENPHVVDGIVLTKFDTIDDKVS